MTSIALINPPSPFLIDDGVMPPLGIMYLSSYLKSKGIRSEIIDFATNDVQESDLIGYDIYAVTSTTPQYPYIINSIINPKRLKKINPKSTTIVGGAHATAFKEECRKDGFDCVVIGEGEKSLFDICKFVENGKIYNNRIGGIIRSKQIKDIDSIPFPDRTFKGFEKYHYDIDSKLSTTMITSRGCPFDCYFCCKTWTGVRLRSAKNIIEETKILKDMGFDGIMFYDDTFTINRNRVIEIAKGLKELGFVWRCFIHASTVNYNLLKIMYESGCVEVGMGVESGSNDILKIVNKKIDIDRAIQVCNWCHEIGLRIKTFLIIGLPGESKETINETINFLKLSKPDDFDYTIYTPFPETEIWNSSNKNDLQFDIQFDKNKLDYSKMFYKGITGKYSAQISTSHLTQEDIEKYRDYVDIEIRKEIIQ